MTAGRTGSHDEMDEEATPSPTYGSLLSSLSSQLGSAVKARWVLERASGRSNSELTARLRDPVERVVEAEALRIVDRVLSGEPLQYALGSWEFRLVEVTVDPRALVPRPETERVVDFALEELTRISEAAGGTRPLVAVDLGTGSGAIALSLAAEFEGALRVRGQAPGLRVFGTDSSAEALDVARRNLSELAERDPDAAGRVRLSQGTWFDALPGELAGGVDLVVSNPPYLSEAEWYQVDAVIRDHEPRSALVAGESGLEALERIIEESPRWIAAGGSLVVELAPSQADAVADFARAAGFVDVEVRPDLSGLKRALVARRHAR